MNAQELDTNDPLADKRNSFNIPDGVIYLDGNSLGMLPKAVAQRVHAVVQNEWGESLIKGWNDHDWIGLPQRVGAKIGALIGAAPSTVIAADSTSISLVKALSAATSMCPDRKIILSDTGNFPTDLYVAQGMINMLGQGHELRLVEPEGVAGAIDDTVAVLMLTEVDYKTGRRHDMAGLTEIAHAAGAVTVWDLAHSAGAMEIDLTSSNADFAVGCGYKYLNGGPGAPAFIYVRPDHTDQITPYLSGWMGHIAPFAFDLEYRPAEGIDRMLVGTPSILSLSALDSALDVWADVDMKEIRSKSMKMSAQFIDEVETKCAGHGLRLISPRDSANRGSQVSFQCPHGYAVMQALIANGVIGDFRAPDIIRFGFAPLYLSYTEIDRAVVILERVLRESLWQNPEYQKKAKVT